MKNYFSIIMATLLAATLMFTSCEKDEAQPVSDPSADYTIEYFDEPFKASFAGKKSTSGVLGVNDVEYFDGSVPSYYTPYGVNVSVSYSSTENHSTSSTGSVSLDVTPRTSLVTALHCDIEGLSAGDDLDLEMMHNCDATYPDVVYFKTMIVTDGGTAGIGTYHQVDDEDVWNSISWDIGYAYSLGLAQDLFESTDDFYLLFYVLEDIDSGDDYRHPFYIDALSYSGTISTTPTMSGTTSMTIPAVAMPYVSGFSATSGHDDYEWDVPSGVTILYGDGTNAITFQTNNASTTIECRVKDDGEHWSEWESRTLNLTITQ